jgi:hypothetical protein
MAGTGAAAVPVGTLTDAELAVLGRPRSRAGPRPVMPVWSRLGPAQRATAARDARASLVARRLLEPHARSRDDLRRDLRSVVVLRESAGASVAVARAAPHGCDHWYAHVTGDVVLLERVSGDGVHHFALTAAATLPTLVVAAVLHPRAAVASAVAPDHQTDWLRADVELRASGPPHGSAWVSGPAGTWAVSVDGASADRPVPPDEVRQLLTGALAGVVHREVRPSGRDG